MSTFSGTIQEFPDIRIDNFCGLDQRPALACFLSHVHSDHLKGLETLKSPFVYCSPATREILLRLEKISSRLNYAQGITESRNPTYRDLDKIVKPLPLETPVVLELKPGSQIQVTLLDANHCVGAVMFLIEGGGKAVLYTGDIRSEPWWVNATVRSPCMVEYSSGLKLLDCIYLDTSIVDDYHQQTKAEGLRELLLKVAQYPADTIFHFQAWTYGYEEVWIMLAKAFQSKIHVDDYKMRIYKSLISSTKPFDDRFPFLTPLTKEAPYLVGFTRGNGHQEGCLTSDENVRIHSCEKGTRCSVMENIQEKPVVWIRPIVAHLKDGQDVAEAGIGGGGDDLVEKSSLRDLPVHEIEPLIMMNVHQELHDTLRGFLQKITNDEPQQDSPKNSDLKSSPPKNMINSVQPHNSVGRVSKANLEQVAAGKIINGYPDRITFPYARHSALPELRHLVQTFKPMDVWPCTFDFASWESRGITVQGLFGNCCSGRVFAHDALMEQMRESQMRVRAESTDPGDTQRTVSSHPTTSSPARLPTDTPEPEEPTVASAATPSRIPTTAAQGAVEPPTSQTIQPPSLEEGAMEPPPRQSAKRTYEDFQEGNDETEPILESDSQTSILSEGAYDTRLQAFRAAESMMNGDGWSAIGLISTTDHHTIPEEELGSG